MTRLLSVVLLSLLGSCAHSVSASPNARTPGYAWQGPQGWRGGSFSSPPAFARDLAFEGREVLRFSPGFYEPAAADHWTYAFVFLLAPDAVTEREHVEHQLERYFVGLGRNLGPNADPNLADEAVVVSEATGDAAAGRARVHAYDPWQGQAVDLFVGWSVQACETDERKALMFELSRAPFDDESRRVLEAEADALRCW